MKESPEIVLVLGGGGARGIAHIHVLQAFDDLGAKPSRIIGSSIGAIMGAAYAAGMSGDEIRDHALEALGNSAQVMARLWRMIPGGMGSMFREGARFNGMDGVAALRAFLPERIPEDFESLAIPLEVTATDFYAARAILIGEGPLYPALAASSAIPGVIRPEPINGRHCVDGGIASPLGFDLAEPSNALVAAVDVVGMPRGSGDEAKAPGRVEAIIGASQIMMQAITSLKREAREPDLLIRPEVDEFRAFDFLHARRIFERTEPAREQARAGLEEILSR